MLPTLHIAHCSNRGIASCIYVILPTWSQKQDGVGGTASTAAKDRCATRDAHLSPAGARYLDPLELLPIHDVHAPVGLYAYSDQLWANQVLCTTGRHSTAAALAMQGWPGPPSEIRMCAAVEVRLGLVSSSSYQFWQQHDIWTGPRCAQLVESSSPELAVLLTLSALKSFDIDMSDVYRPHALCRPSLQPHCRHMLLARASKGLLTLTVTSTGTQPC